MKDYIGIAFVLCCLIGLVAAFCMTAPPGLVAYVGIAVVLFTSVGLLGKLLEICVDNISKRNSGRREIKP